MRKWIAIVTSVVAALTTGCGSDDESSETPAAPAALRGAAFDIVTVKPLVGLDVCSVSHPSVACVKTDDVGNFKMTGLPANTEVLLSISGDDNYLKVIKTATTGDPGSSTVIFDVLIPTQQAADLVFGQIGVAQDTAKGMLIFEAVTPDPTATETNGQRGVAGASIVAPGADGPFYLNAAGLPDKTLTVTGEGGHALLLNVPVGELEATMTAPADKNCYTHPVLSWAGSAALTARVPIEANTVSYSAAMECDP